MLNRDQDIARLNSLKATLASAVAESMTGLDCRTSADQPDRWMDPQDQREADLIGYGDDDINDPAYRDWCVSAKLEHEMAEDNIEAVAYLRENDPLFDLQNQIYLYESQQENKHDRIMMDVPKEGRRKGGTHGAAPEKRRIRYSKVVNPQLVPTALIQVPGADDVHDVDRQERAEAEQWRLGGNARLAREFAYCLSVYKGKYRAVLELMAELKTVPQIAEILGKTSRRIQQIVHGNAQKGRKPKPGLEQICREIVAAGIPSDFQSPAPTVVHQTVPVIVQPVRTRKKSLQKAAVLGQLAWDFDALEMGVAA